MLPDEMWEEILRHVDLLDLQRLRTVSKQWLCVIDRVIEREGKWYIKCLKEVPKKYWTSILEHHTNPELSGCDFYKSRRHSPIWITMYKSWIGWNNLIDKMTRQTTIDFTKRRQFINSLSVSSNIIAIGVYDWDAKHGHVDVYDITQLNNGPLFVGRGPVMDVQVWRKANNLKVASYCYRGMVHWNIAPLLCSPQRTAASPLFTKISANLGYCYTLTDPFELPDYRCTLTIERLSDLDSRIITWRKTDNSCLLDIVADGDKVTILSIDTNNSSFLKINEITSKSGELTNISTIPCPRILKNSRIFKPCVVVYLTNEGDASDIGFSVAGRELKIYNVVQHFKLNSQIRSYCYHIGLLILGLVSGEICIIYVKDADQLENLNIETMRYKILTLDESPITHVAVTEYNSTQCIIAATRKKLHLVEFY